MRVDGSMSFIGFLVSLWLNYGAAKLQYYRLFQSRLERSAVRTASTRIAEEEEWDASPPIDQQEEEPLEPLGDSERDLLFFVPQETNFFRMMCFWAVLASYASWFTDNR